MNTSTKKVHRSIVSLKLPTQAAALIVYAQNMVKGMTGNPAFPNPVPPLATVTAAIDDMHAAETAALMRTKGAATVRNEKRVVLVQHLQQLKGYVQLQADANPENSASIIQSAGVALRKTPTRRARAFAAKPGALSGTVDIIAASAGQRASYEWEYSTDGGKTWTVAPPTMQAKTSIAGLQAGTTVQFRYRPVTRAGASDWSAPVSLIVQ
jgi:hypothetical protein